MSCAPSAPLAASPKKMRVTSERRPLVPVTPQRINSVQKQNRFASSPMTPSNSSITLSPFTPITNIYSSSPNFATPNSSVSSQTRIDSSPNLSKSKGSKSLADSTNNWRTRAKENGIKVGADAAAQKEDIPISFLSTHRRSRQALFQTKSSDSTAFISPKAARLYSDEKDEVAPVYSTSDLSAALLSTPEANGLLGSSLSLTTPSPQTSLAIAQRLRQRGSLTDPARTRRREVFGSIAMKASPLFDIDENGVDSRASYAPYPQAFGSPLTLTSRRKPIRGLRSVSAPFFTDGLEAESDEEEVGWDEVLPAVRLTRSHLRPIKSAESFAANGQDLLGLKGENPRLPAIHACSVCSVSSGALSSLTPCGHVVCSSCLTGALNIVGEKDMRCATCEEKVLNFKLLAPVPVTSVNNGQDTSMNDERVSADDHGDDHGFHAGAINAAYVSENVEPKKHFEVVQPPPAGFVSHQEPRPITSGHASDPAVLRIDNVPWDITPFGLRDFFSPFSLLQAHVLLDPKGKTLSHAYVEIARTDARDALRAVQNKTMGKGKRLRGVTVTMSNQGELMRAIFPTWLGGFDGMHPTLVGLDNASVARTLERGLISQSELEGLLMLMRNPKSHFLKVPSLPFYSLVSILVKFPVDDDSRVFWSARLRDTLFDLTIAAINNLISRIGTDLHRQGLLEDVVAAGTQCNAFTEMQIHHLLHITDQPNCILSITDTRHSLASLHSASSSATSQAEDVLTPDDSASVASKTSGTQGSYVSAKPFGHNRMRREDVKGMSHATSLLPTNTRHSGNTLMPMPMDFGLVTPHNTPYIQYGAVVNPELQFPRSPFDTLAQEWGVEPGLVAALAQRLAITGTPSNMIYSGQV